MGKGWQSGLTYVGAGLVLGYLLKDQLGQFFAGLQQKAVGAIPVPAAPMPVAPVAPGAPAPTPAAPTSFGAQPTGQVPVRQTLAGEALYPGAFPPQGYDPENEYYGVAYPAVASSIVIPSRRYDRDYTRYDQADLNSIPPLW